MADGQVEKFPGYSSERLDDAIVNPDIYADDAAMHEMFSILRRDDPVRFVQPRGFRPFWAITKHSDILEVERQPEVFVNRLRTYLSPIEGEEWVKSVTGTKTNTGNF